MTGVVAACQRDAITGSIAILPDQKHSRGIYSSPAVDRGRCATMTAARVIPCFPPTAIEPKIGAIPTDEPLTVVTPSITEPDSWLTRSVVIELDSRLHDHIDGVGPGPGNLQWC